MDGKLTHDMDWIFVEDPTASVDESEVGKIVCALDGADVRALCELWPDDEEDEPSFVGVRGDLDHIVDWIIGWSLTEIEDRASFALAWADMFERSAARIRQKIG